MTKFPPLPSAAAMLVEDFRDHLTDARKADGTVVRYCQVATYFLRHQVGHDLPVDPTLITRLHVSGYLRFVRKQNAAATHVGAYYALRAFFTYLLEAKEITASPMIGVATPKDPPLTDVPLLPTDALEQMIPVCREHRHAFYALRDEAIVRLFWDTPGRLTELHNVSIKDVDLAARSIRVLGKGGKDRTMRFTRSTAMALRRYLKVRPEFADGGDALWIGRGGGSKRGRGAMTSVGVYLVIKRTALAAGLGDIHPHQFRHTFADRWLEADGQEIDLINLAGWSGPKQTLALRPSWASRRALGAYDRVLG